MIRIFKFRQNDLNSSLGKQIEFNKEVVDSFFEFTTDEVDIKITYKSLSNVADRLNGKQFKGHLKLSPSRGDYKIYENLDESISMKGFFLTDINLNNVDNINDFFALVKNNNVDYDLYYIPASTNIANLFSAIKNSNIAFPSTSEARDVVGKQIVYYGAPGTGKSYEIQAITASQEHIRTTFHPDSDYSTFVGAYKPTMTKVELRDVTGKVIVEHGEKVTEDKIVYNYVPQSFLQSYTSAWNNYPINQFLIIEEINRGNCAQIFGDLFQLLDRSNTGFSDYPIQADNDIKNYIANYFIDNNIADKISENKEKINAIYANKCNNAFERILSGELLVLPSNLNIFATMNTSDQSLFPIDSAFKRRWDWVYKPIADAGKGWIITTNGVDYDWWSFVEKINEKIFDTTNSEDKKLGYFFVKADNKGVITAERFVGKVIFYLWNDVFKDYGFDDDIFLDNKDNKVLAFQKFYNIDGTVNESILERFLNNLKVNESDDSDTEEESSESNSTKDHSRYSINGEGFYKKGPLARKLLELYVSDNEQRSSDEVVRVWNELNLGMKHFVENTQMKDERIEKSSDGKLRGYRVDCNGETIFITNQWNTVNIAKLIEKINSAGWGYSIVKLEE